MVSEIPSKATPAVNSSSSVQHPTASLAQDEHLSVNFVLFDRPNPCRPLSLNVPRLLKAQDCRDLFSYMLSEEFDIDVKKSSISFWKPNELLLLDTVIKRGWSGCLNDIEAFCTPIPLPRPLATALQEEIHNVDIVHLVVTVATPGQSQGSPSTNSASSAQRSYEDLERQMLDYILSRSDSAEGAHVRDIIMAIGGHTINDPQQINFVIENLLECGRIYTTVDDSHFRAA